MAVTRLGEHLERLRVLALSDDNKWLAYGGFRDVKSAVSQQKEVDCSKILASAEITPPASVVYIVSWPNLDGTQFIPSPGRVSSLLWLPNNYLLISTVTGSVCLWKVGDAIEFVAQYELGSNQAAHKVCSLGQVQASNGGNVLRVACACQNGNVQVLDFNPKSKEIVSVFNWPLSTQSLKVLAWAPDAKLLVTGDEQIIYVLTTQEQQEPRSISLESSGGGISSLVITPDLRFVVGSTDGSILIGYLQGDPEVELRSSGKTGHEGVVYDLCLSSDAERLYSVAADGALKSWTLDNRRAPKTLDLGDSAVFAIVYGKAQKSSYIAAVNQKRRLRKVVLDNEGRPNEVEEDLASRWVSFKRALDARKVETRLEAIKALELLPEDEAVMAIQSVLRKDKQSVVRAAAAQALGRMKRQRAVVVLSEALSDSGQEVRKAAFEAIVSIEGEKSISPHQLALLKSKPDIQRHALSLLPAMRVFSPLVPGLIAQALSHTDKKVRFTALDALIELEDADNSEEGMLSFLQATILRGPGDIRLAALIKLAQTSFVETDRGQQFLQRALDDDDSSVRHGSFLLMIGIRSKLSEQLSKVDTQLEKKLKVLFAGVKLNQINQHEDFQVLCRPLLDATSCRHVDIALAGSRSLMLLGDGRATGVVLQLTRDQNADVCLAACNVLRDVAKLLRQASQVDVLSYFSNTTIGRLKWLIQDNNPALRSKAFDALLEIQEAKPEQLELVYWSIGSAFEDIRLRGLQLLLALAKPEQKTETTELPSANVLDGLLADALDDESQKVRSEAYKVLWAWHQDDKKVPLEIAAKCRHADLRLKVVNELKRDVDNFASKLLTELLNDASAEVALAAYFALGAEDAPLLVQRRALTAARPELRIKACELVPYDHRSKLGGVCSRFARRRESRGSACCYRSDR